MKPELTGIVETLLIPTRARAYETGLKNALLHDPWAVKIMAQYDDDQSNKKTIYAGTLIGTVLRTLSFDQKITQFMQQHRDSIIVNLGCGLDARHQRLACPSELLWFDLDVAEAMNLRKQFFQDESNYTMLTYSMFNTQWMADIPKNKPIMIFFEGVSMYFPEDRLKSLILKIFEQFPQAELVFDVLSKLNSRHSQAHPDVKKYNVSFKWGIDSANELLQWDKNIQIISEESYMVKKPLHRWPLSLRLLRWLPMIQRMGRVIHIRYQT